MTQAQRTIDVAAIAGAVEKALRIIAVEGAAGLKECLVKLAAVEPQGRSKTVLGLLVDNLAIAKEDAIPLCQDTGMAIIFLRIGQDVRLTGGSLKDALNGAVARAYGPLRKSVVADPLERKNTGDNTPAVIHYEIVDGTAVDITVMAKGFGSENTSRLFMLTPADGTEGVIKAVVATVEQAGSKGCPPYFVGVGIGGTAEQALLLAKKALCRDLGVHSGKKHIKELEQKLFAAVNQLGIGPMGFGGTATALWTAVETAPTHIAGLPVAVNLCCHAVRHQHLTL